MGGRREKGEGREEEVTKEGLPDATFSRLSCNSYLLCGNSAQHTGVANTKLRVV